MNSLTRNQDPQTCANGFLNQEEVQIFHKQGYFIKKNAVENQELDYLDKATEAMIRVIKTEIASEKYPISDQQQITYIKGSQIVLLMLYHPLTAAYI